eukprot:COSAG01_NODE_9786_length_2343_cov_9.324866_1_plen_98_part_10
MLPLCERRWEEVRRVLDDKCVADFLEVKREAEKQVRPQRLSLSRGGCPNRWCSLENCSHGDSLTGRFGRTALSLAPQLAGLALAGGVGPGVEDGGAGA